MSIIFNFMRLLFYVQSFNGKAHAKHRKQFGSQTRKTSVDPSGKDTDNTTFLDRICVYANILNQCKPYGISSRKTISTIGTHSAMYLAVIT